ncbi:uncharacterized protein LOC116850355 isoform X2 [Odontomachus brunneus]|uniref:uncharacterized protein LOC116850355 isoform X2 n=1 Tax=Odontomachus brunneus TaxID=486640 RepID=UPI0013F23B67|nr:uncharacterized protein LOC116850355 isoform X2 [Odontomachus brunneus]
MADYSPNEIVDIILVLGECHSNYNAASRLYAQRFPERRHPTDMTIRSLVQRARNGHLVRQRQHHEYDENDARAVTISAIVHLNPHVCAFLR